MRQANNRDLQSNRSAVVNVPIAIMDEEEERTARIERLRETRHSVQLCNGTKKKSILLKVLDHKKVLCKLASEADAALGNTDILEKLEGLFKGAVLKSSNKINGANNEALSTVIVTLFDLFELLLDFDQGRDDGVQHNTRNAARAVPSHLKLMKEFITLRDKVDAQIQEHAAHDPNDKLLAGIALTPAQKSMKFDKRRVPEDKAQQICVFCNHRSTNEGENNDKCEDNNRKKAATRAAKMKVWEPYAKAREEWEKSGGNGPEPERPLDPHTKNPMMRKPKKLTNLDSPELQCMCLNSSCAQVGSDTGSTCFVLCRVISEQQEVGEDHPSAIARTISQRHPVEKDGTRSKCTCPICQCKCCKRYKISDIQKIASKKAQNAHLRAQQQPQQTGEAETANFLRNVLSGGAVGANTALSSSRGLVEGADTEQVMSDNFYGSAAMLAARTGANSFTPAGMGALQRGLGRSTTVTLPSGDTFDTRMISANKNAHRNNNRMPGEEEMSNNPTQPGMLDNLHPDYSSMSTAFTQASRNGNLASHLLRAAAAQPNNTANTEAAVAASAAASAAASTDGQLPIFPIPIEPPKSMNECCAGEYCGCSQGPALVPDASGVMTTHVCPNCGGKYHCEMFGCATKFGRIQSEYGFILDDRLVLPSCPVPSQHPNRIICAKCIHALKSPSQRLADDLAAANAGPTLLGMSYEDQIQLAITRSTGGGTTDHPTRAQGIAHKHSLNNHGEAEDGTIHIDQTPPSLKQPSTKQQRKPSAHPPLDLFGYEERAQKKKKSGGERIMNRVSRINAQQLHNKKKKKDRTKEQRAERKKAKLLETKLNEYRSQGKLEHLGNTIAMGCGVGMSQISAYESGRVADADGDYFQSQDGLAQVENLLLEESSSEEDEDEEKNQD